MSVDAVVTWVLTRPAIRRRRARADSEHVVRARYVTPDHTASWPDVYWRGPEVGAGTTYGPFGGARVFPSRDDAEIALRSVYGSTAEVARHGYTAVPYAVARRAEARRQVKS